MVVYAKLFFDFFWSIFLVYNYKILIELETYEYL